MEGEALYQFSNQLLNDPSFRENKKNALRGLYDNRDEEDSGFLQGGQGLAFIDEAYATMTG